MNAIQHDGAGPFLVKDPLANLPITVDWSAWLLQEGTTIASSLWVAQPGLTLSNVSNTTTAAQASVSGGLLDETYEVRNTITCANGSIDSRSLRIRCKAR